MTRLGWAAVCSTTWIAERPAVRRDAGFADISVQAEIVPITTPPLAEIMPKLAADAAVEAGAVDAAARWLADQSARLDRRTFFAVMTHFIAIARRRS